MKRVKENGVDLLIFKASFWDTKADFDAGRRPRYQEGFQNNFLEPHLGKQVRRIHPTKPRRHQWQTTRGVWRDRPQTEADLTDPTLDLLRRRDVIAREAAPVHDPVAEIHGQLRRFVRKHSNLIMDNVPDRFDPALDAKAETDTKPDSIINMRRDGSG